MIVECPRCRSRYDVTGRPPGTTARCRCGATFPLPEPPATARVLSCPQCGAVCPPNRDRCAYCDAVLAVVACPRCFGLLFLGAKHCQHCGAAIDVPARAPTEGQEIPLACPRCAVAGKAEPLVANLVGDTLLDTCAGCGGIWLDSAALERVIAQRHEQATISEAGSSRKSGVMTAVQLGGKVEKVAYLRCPECGDLMRRTNFGRRSGIVVDVCRPHGTWFDRDELRLVLEWVMNGGLEAAARAEAEELRREVAAKKEQIRELGQSTGAGLDIGGGAWRGSHGSFELVFQAIARWFVS